MKRCLAVILVTLSLGLFATSSHAQASRTYKPCFEDPIFEEESFAQPSFEEAEFEPGKRDVPQVEKPVFEVPIRELPKLEVSFREIPQFVEAEFDNGCTKPAPAKTVQPITWLGAYAPKKISLMKPLVAQTSKTTKTSLSLTRPGSRLLAVSKLR